MDWNDIMGDSAYVRAWLKRRARARRVSRMLAMLSAVVLLAAIGVGVWPFLQRDGSDRRLAAAAERATVAAQSFPAGSRNAMVERAVEYNRLLLEGGQSVFGGSVDPVSGESDDDFDGEKDPEYHELLKTDALGTMARIRVPKVNIDLPVYHGAGQNTLDMGAGHLYGSSLPVGGKGSHTVITAHTNSADGMFFTRLDEMGKGDMFYIDVLGHTLAYRVNRIELVDPTGRTADYATLAARKGVDEATLLTCSGSGNTKRLLVTGVRVPYSPSGEQRSAGHPEAAAYALPIAALAAVPGLAVVGVGECRHRRRGWEQGVARHERSHAPLDSGRVDPVSGDAYAPRQNNSGRQDGEYGKTEETGRSDHRGSDRGGRHGRTRHGR